MRTQAVQTTSHFAVAESRFRGAAVIYRQDSRTLVDWGHKYQRGKDRRAEPGLDGS